MDALGIALALVLVAANGFFVAVEFGLARLRPTQAAEFARRRRPGAKSVLHAVEPEQSTVAIVAHHPQAVYFGMKSGFLPKSERQARDELIAGTDKDPANVGVGLPDAEPAEAAV